MTSKSTVSFKGTPIYIAPEVWCTNEYTKAGDVYAFSIIVYELLTLEKPFINYDLVNLYTKVAINGERPIFNYPIPKCYMDLITRCWDQDPKKRPTFFKFIKSIISN